MSTAPASTDALAAPPACAIVLAAGVSRRMGDALARMPKCLLRIDGRTLLDRHLLHLQRLGVPHVVLVTGYAAERIASHTVEAHRIVVQHVHNPNFREGNILSLRCGLTQAPEGDVLVMDADVLYHPEVLARIVGASGLHFLLDETSTATGEEMMVATRGGRVHLLARTLPEGPWDVVGETVGFFRVPATLRSDLLDAIAATVAAGGRDAEYETALNHLLESHPGAFSPVGDLPWIEIDFPEDVERARSVVWPAIREAEQATLGAP